MRQTRKGNFFVLGADSFVHERSQKCGLTKYHANLARYLKIGFIDILTKAYKRRIVTKNLSRAFIISQVL